MSYLDEMDAIANRAQQKKQDGESNYLDEMDKIAKSTSIHSQKEQNSESRHEKSPLDTALGYAKEGLHGGKMVAQSISQAPLRVLDLPQALINLPEAIKAGIAGKEPDFLIDPENFVSNIVKRFIKENTGLDWDSEKPQNAPERLFKSATDFGSDMIAGGAIGRAVEAAPYIGRVLASILGSNKTLGQSASSGVVGATTGVASQGLQELGVDPLTANLTAGVGVPAGVGAYNLAKGVKDVAKDSLPTTRNALSQAHDEAAAFLKDRVGANNIESVISSIDNYKPPMEGYTPPTSDIVQNPGVAQIHRTLQGSEVRPLEGMPTISEQQIENSKMLTQKLEDLSPSEYGIQATKEHVGGIHAQEQEKIQQAVAAQMQEIDKRMGHLEAARAALEQQAERLQLEAQRKRQAAVNQFDKTATAEEAGKDIQEFLSTKTKAIRKKAYKETGPLYEEALKSPEKIEAAGALSYIKQEISKHSGTIKGDLAQAEAAINPPAAELKRIKKANSGVEAGIEELRTVPESENLMRAFLEQNPLEKPFTDTERLKNALIQIESMIEAIPHNEKNRRRILGNVKSALEKDLAKAPKLSAADTKYRELIAPANLIEENPILSKVIKNDKSSYSREFAMAQGDVPNSIIKVSKDPVGARELARQIKDNKGLQDRIKHYIHKMIIDDFVGSNGKIKVDNFNRWRQANKGAFVLYPGLDNKLNNLQSSQRFVDEVVVKNKRMLSNLNKRIRDETKLAQQQQQKTVSTGSKEGEKVKKIILDELGEGGTIGAILEGRSKIKTMREAVKLAKTDSTGASLEGLKSDALNHMKKKFGPDLTFNKLDKYLKNYKESLTELFDKEGIQLLEDIRTALERRSKTASLGKDAGSPTHGKGVNFAKLAESETLFTTGKNFLREHGGKKIPFLKGFLEKFDKMKAEERVRLVTLALSEPKKFKEMMLHQAKEGPTLRGEWGKARNKFGEYLKAPLFKTAVMGKDKDD